MRWFLLAGLLLPGTAAAQGGVEAILCEGTRINLQLNENLSTRSNTEGDPFTATVIDPVYLKDRIVIPKGSIVSGNISRIVPPGRFKGKAVMNLVFNSIRVPGAAELPIVASLARLDPGGNVTTKDEGTITTGSAKGKDAAKVVTPTLTGAGIGAIVDGGRGAVIGAGIGAAIGILTARNAEIEVKRGSTMEIVLDRPLTIPTELIKRIDQ